MTVKPCWRDDQVYPKTHPGWRLGRATLASHVAAPAVLLNHCKALGTFLCIRDNPSRGHTIIGTQFVPFSCIMT